VPAHTGAPLASVARFTPMKPQPLQVMPQGLASTRSARLPNTSIWPARLLAVPPVTSATMRCAATPCSSGLAAMLPTKFEPVVSDCKGGAGVLKVPVAGTAVTALVFGAIGASGAGGPPRGSLQV